MSFKDKVRNLLSNSKLWRSVRFVQNLLSNSTFWLSLGFVSNAGGMVCLALSPSFQRLIGKWYMWKIYTYVVLTVILTVFMLCVEKGQIPKCFRSKIFIPSCVLILSNAGSYLYDKAINGKPDILGVTSMGLLALSALSFSRLIDMGFEVGFFTFFLGQFFLELLQIHRWLVVVGAIFCSLAIAARVYSEELRKEGLPTSDSDVRNEIENSGGGALKLSFVTKLPPKIFTSSDLTSKNGGPVLIALLDFKSADRYSILNDGPLSSLSIEICALNGEFGSNRTDGDWTANEFNSNIVGSGNKGPLLGGETRITLKDGVACIPGIKFTDSSSWIRIGAKIEGSNSDQVNIKPAISNPFAVQDDRELAVEMGSRPENPSRRRGKNRPNISGTADDFRTSGKLSLVGKDKVT